MSRRHQPQRKERMSGEAQAFVATMAFIIAFIGVGITFPKFFMTIWLGSLDVASATFTWLITGGSGFVLIWGFAIVGGAVIVGGVYLVLEQVYHWATGSAKQSAASEYRVK